MSTKRSLVAHRLCSAFAVLGALWGSGTPVAEAQEAHYVDAEAVVVAPGDVADKATWGVEDVATYSVSGSAFQAELPDHHVVKTNDGQEAKWYIDEVVFDSSPTDWASTPLTLPTGALVTAVEVSGCDKGSFGQLIWRVQRGSDSGVSVQLNPDASTGHSETPGCGFFHQALPTPFRINNLAYSYFVSVNIPPSPTEQGETFSLTTFRVYYKLQVSPPPGSATFSDVPTGHPFFRYVEALARSGITSGCGGNRFCPGAPLTRGQMAVFLAKALGLHWPN